MKNTFLLKIVSIQTVFAIQQGCHLVFYNFFQGFLNFFKVLKVHIFRSIFSLKLGLRLKTMLNIIKTLKRYCKATLNVFKKNLGDDKKKLSI